MRSVGPRWTERRLHSVREGLSDWLAVALAELRTIRRLVRTWMFLALGIVVVGMAYWYYSYLPPVCAIGWPSPSRRSV